MTWTHRRTTPPAARGGQPAPSDEQSAPSSGQSAPSSGKPAAPGPLDFALRPMQLADLDAVVALERVSFSDPWSRQSFESEVDDPQDIHWARVALRGELLAGYVVAWFVLDEAHVANIAVAPMYRSMGLGRRLLMFTVAEARRRGARWLGLEVRPSNKVALGLYRSSGFRLTGVRKGYYRDNREDALVLTLELRAPIDGS